MFEKEGSLVCEKTGMEMSPIISSHIKEYFVHKKPVPYKAELNPLSEATWFCPGCGAKMDISEGLVSCPKCHQSLNPFIRTLTELYFHLPLDRD